MKRRKFLKTAGFTALALKHVFSTQYKHSKYKTKDEFMEEVDKDKRDIDYQIKLWEHIDEWCVADWKKKAEELRNKGIRYPMNDFIVQKISRLEGKIKKYYPKHTINSSEFRKAYEILYEPFLDEEVAAYTVKAKGRVIDVEKQFFDKFTELYPGLDPTYNFRFVAKEIGSGFQNKDLLPSTVGGDNKSGEYVLNIPNYSLFIHSSHMELIGPEPKVNFIGNNKIKVLVAKSNRLIDLIESGKIDVKIEVK